ncbi:hypothetical protein KAI12_01990 [Candidatus Bathyarchaeota archaeon]|nr:hypothetical protein [Candidatus Bathyarchaeota archaeon]
MNVNSNKGPLKIGIFLVALTWFLFTLYQFPKAAINIGQLSDWMFLTDTVGVIGLSFRTVASFFAVITALFFLLGKGLSKTETIMSVRWIILGEAVFFFSLLPSGAWGFVRGQNLDYIWFLIETGIPCLVASIVIPVVLIKLFFELGSNKSGKGAIKWALISLTAYIFVFWLDNTVNWLYAVNIKGIEYLTNYPLNLLSFVLTTVGLLALTMYAAYFSKKSFGKSRIAELNLKRLGVIVTALGLYFLVIYMMWIFFGSVGGWGAWYQWFLGHNMHIWLMSLPLVGVPLLFYKKK